MIKFSLILCMSYAFLFADYFHDAALAYKNADYAKARELFELSIKKDNYAQGYFFLGKIYLYGEGVEANPSLAIPYLEQSVMRGNVKAKCYLAEAYIKSNIKREEVLILLNQGVKETSTCKEIAITYHISLNS